MSMSVKYEIQSVHKVGKARQHASGRQYQYHEALPDSARPFRHPPRLSLWYSLKYKEYQFCSYSNTLLLSSSLRSTLYFKLKAYVLSLLVEKDCKNHLRCCIADIAALWPRCIVELALLYKRCRACAADPI